MDRAGSRMDGLRERSLDGIELLMPDERDGEAIYLGCFSNVR